jgi:hypothetical protein
MMGRRGLSVPSPRWWEFAELPEGDRPIVGYFIGVVAGTISFWLIGFPAGLARRLGSQRSELSTDHIPAEERCDSSRSHCPRIADNRFGYYRTAVRDDTFDRKSGTDLQCNILCILWRSRRIIVFLSPSATRRLGSSGTANLAGPSSSVAYLCVQREHRFVCFLVDRRQGSLMPWYSRYQATKRGNPTAIGMRGSKPSSHRAGPISA